MSNYKASEIASAIQNLQLVFQYADVWVGTQTEFEELQSISNTCFYCIIEDNEPEEEEEEVL